MIKKTEYLKKTQKLHLVEKNFAWNCQQY